MKYLILMAILFGCAEPGEYGRKFRSMKRECQNLAQKLQAEYEVGEVNSEELEFYCEIIDKRVDYKYSLYGEKAVAGAIRGIYIHNQFKTNVAFNKCVLKEIPGATLGGNKYSLNQKSAALDKCRKEFPNRMDY